MSDKVPSPKDPGWRSVKEDKIDGTIYYKHEKVNGLYYIGSEGMIKA